MPPEEPESFEVIPNQNILPITQQNLNCIQKCWHYLDLEEDYRQLWEENQKFRVCLNLENRAYNTTAYTGGGSVISADGSNTQLILASEYATGFIGFDVGGRTKATERLNLSSTNLGLELGTTLSQDGSSSGTITFKPQAAAGTYNWNWPTTAGSIGQALISQGGSTSAMTWATVAAPVAPAELYNVGLSQSIGSSALTVALKQVDGSTDPSTGTSVVKIGFRSSTATSGAINERTISAALSQTISSGTTLGIVANVSTPVYIYAIDSDGAGTIKIGLDTQILDETILQSSVAESASVTATNASPCVFTETAHGRSNGDAVTLTGTPPATGFATATTYYIVSKATNTYQLAATPGGTAINSTSTGTSVVVHTASAKLATLAAYTSEPVRALGKVWVSLSTPGTWTTPSELDLIAPTPQPGPRAPTVQRFTSSSGTYLTPPGVLYIEIEMVGGGAGGGGSGTSTGTGAGSGGDSKWGGTSGSPVLDAGGGIFGPFGGSNGGAGGTCQTNAGPTILVAATGGSGGGAGAAGGATAVDNEFPMGGMGGASAYGASGGSGGAGNGALGGAANTGAGGGGGSMTNTATTSNAGSGGGAGCFIKAIISNPFSSYAYTVGTFGAGGGAGAGGTVGGAGGSGLIVVTEHYQ